MSRSPLVLLLHGLVIGLGTAAAWVTVEMPELARSAARFVYAGLGALILIGLIASAVRSGDDTPRCGRCNAELGRFSGVDFCHRCGEESGRSSPS